MKIGEVLQITSIPDILGVIFKGSEFVYASNSPTPFKLDNNMILYQADMTVECVNVLDCFAQTRKITEGILAQYFDLTHFKQRQLNRYMVLYFILEAAYTIKGQNQSVTKDELIRYEEALAREINRCIDFSAIEDMRNLQYTISNNDFLRELSYSVNETKGKYKKFRTTYKKMPPLYFGNTRYCEATARVIIDVYEDMAMLSYSGLDAEPSEEVTFGEYDKVDLEGKILRVLDKWAGRWMR